uniref:Bardet-Biedl syndrome 1 N-terminal domain-containing protein n=1 Tax=Parascaris univalens TaxID=6257 RepID=A0A915BCB5_PARUN
MSNKWVSALHDYSAGINSLPSCVGLSDLYGDGDYKLIIGDIGTGRYNMRLKVLKGLTLIGESVLTDLPSAVVPFINELMQPTLPSIAIASGPSILIYKNLKPFYKFNIPTLDVDESENEAWSHAEASQIDSTQLYAVLLKLKEKVSVYDVEYRIFVSSREAEVFTIKRGIEHLDRPTITLKSDIIGMIRISKQIRIYQELSLMDRLKIDSSIKWIRYGPMGREEGALIIGTKTGGLIVKLFRRTAKFDEKYEESGPPAAQTRKLNVPRRTKIFVDQTIREREQAQTMHQCKMEFAMELA